jgi:predicted DCC family thiol-disulfide oxidoreductase YuxK
MNNIFVLYDTDCAFCVQCGKWIASQRQTVPITFIAAGSPEAQRIFPYIDHERTKIDLTVVSDVGGVYHDAKAWLMCLWALTEYRAWAVRLATPELMPSAKNIISTISNNRKTISKMIA